VETIEFEMKKGKLIITCDMPKKGKDSASGKTLVYVSSRGNMDTGLKVDGKPLIVGLNGFVKK
jgi:hypothetical protein